MQMLMSTTPNYRNRILYIIIYQYLFLYYQLLSFLSIQFELPTRKDLYFKHYLYNIMSAKDCIKDGWFSEQEHLWPGFQ